MAPRLLVSRSEPQRKFQVFVDRCELKPIGSIAYRLAKVAAGDGDGTLTFRSIYEWDICAGVLMVEAAGGKVVNGSGKDLLVQSAGAASSRCSGGQRAIEPGLQDLWARRWRESKPRANGETTMARCSYCGESAAAIGADLRRL